MGRRPCLPAGDATAGGGRSGTARSLDAAHRSHARLQRRRRAGAVSRRDRRVPGGLAHARRRRRGRRRRDRRAQYRPHRHTRTRGGIAAVVPHAARLRVAGGADGRHRRNRFYLDARGRRTPVAERGGARSRKGGHRARRLAVLAGPVASVRVGCCRVPRDLHPRGPALPREPSRAGAGRDGRARRSVPAARRRHRGHRSRRRAHHARRPFW